MVQESGPGVTASDLGPFENQANTGPEFHRKLQKEKYTICGHGYTILKINLFTAK